PVKDEDDKEPGIWMIHSGAPTEHAEDPMGMQRPTDRDEETPAEEFADSVSELAEARLVSTPERARDVLISDDPPEAQPHDSSDRVLADTTRIQYPEWDFRVMGYHDPGTTVHVLTPPLGSLQWVEQTLRRHHGLLWAMRRQFEMLRPRRTRRRRQLDGHDVDFDAYVEAIADRRAGRTMPQTLYQNDHHDKRDTAVMLLIDISGSTDSWLSADQRVIDVEREALLLVCTALESVGDPYSVLAFSGEGPHGVMVQTIKRFDETFSTTVARQIAGLEPDRYTRTGAALRHATAMLMKQPARHRLLLLLSDGKPNDADHYEGRYGVEDMRQAVNEATLQGIYPFCLTIDWQAANYLPDVFGARQYALLPKSEHLPTIMLDWLRRLLAS
ncbi:MAG TPA: VWA domain-containing protein, partial [Burkholderiaceae bacterium]|nr:VWA domain-containing protein [Burkholderiaceae bacterium]